MRGVRQKEKIPMACNAREGTCDSLVLKDNLENYEEVMVGCMRLFEISRQSTHSLAGDCTIYSNIPKYTHTFHCTHFLRRTS